ncbi:hypothetical protein [Halomicronema sp. CCY15110]|uniref:hypothetical protein n=1 Tax=Halomicronema sp. CCY15110 TaxID=2767773 RepID=UPI0019503976|nr:hypothetical protein [Halomicronema sp. CCY15110]
MLHFCTTPPRLSGWDKRRFNDLSPEAKKILAGWAKAYFYPTSITRANGNKGWIFALEQTTALLDDDGEPIESHIRTRSILIERKTHKVKHYGSIKLQILKH